MGRRQTEQPPLWIAASDLPMSPGHPFYARLNTILDAAQFDRFVEERCASFYAPVMREGCAEHFRAALTLLQPTVLIAQGRAVRRWLDLVLDEAEPIPGTLPLERVRIGESWPLLASFVHPSAPTRDNWGGNAEQPYLRETVVLTIAALQGAAGMLPT